MAQDIGGGSGGGDYGGGGGSCSGRQRTVPPAFLTKTYQIVDDPNTNSITSWGKFGESFIIWDHITFSAQILPKYFRHNNFASFVYQLNNYGFRKIGVEHHWEYMSPYFQKQKQHLLSNMKRRSEQNPTLRRPRNSLCPEMMMDAINESKLEIEKMKMQQLDMEFHIMALQHQAKTIDNSTKKMIVSWAKACGMILQAKRGREEIGNQNCDDDDEAVSKRKKLVESAEISEMVEEMTIPLSEIQPIDVGKTKSEMGSTYLEFCKKIMLEDDEVCEVEAVSNKHALISQDFQDLITLD